MVTAEATSDGKPPEPRVRDRADEGDEVRRDPGDPLRTPARWSPPRSCALRAGHRRRAARPRPRRASATRPRVDGFVAAPPFRRRRPSGPCGPRSPGRRATARPPGLPSAAAGRFRAGCSGAGARPFDSTLGRSASGSSPSASTRRTTARTRRAGTFQRTPPRREGVGAGGGADCPEQTGSPIKRERRPCARRQPTRRGPGAGDRPASRAASGCSRARRGRRREGRARRAAVAHRRPAEHRGAEPVLPPARRRDR